MWKIGIKSALITVLGLIVYAMFIQLMGLQRSLWGNSAYIVLALGIYSGHYYYKAANDGLMTYKQGLKVGLIVVSFFALLYAFSMCLCIKFIDTSIIMQLAEAAQNNFQQKDGEKIIEQAVQFIQQMAPELLFITMFFGVVLTGFAFTLIIAAFSRNHKKSVQP